MKVLIRTLKGKIFNKITANDSKSYLGYLNKLVVEYKNTYHSSIGRKPCRFLGTARVILLY